MKTEHNEYIVRRWVTYPEFHLVKAVDPLEARAKALQIVKKRHPNADNMALEDCAVVEASTGKVILSRWDEVEAE